MNAIRVRQVVLGLVSVVLGAATVTAEASTTARSVVDAEVVFTCNRVFRGDVETWPLSVRVRTELPDAVTAGEEVVSRDATFSLHVGDLFARGAELSDGFAFDAVKVGIAGAWLNVLDDGVVVEEAAIGESASDWIDLTGQGAREGVVGEVEGTLSAFVMPAAGSGTAALALGENLKLQIGYRRAGVEGDFQPTECTAAGERTFGQVAVTPDTSAPAVTQVKKTFSTTYACVPSGSNVKTTVKLTGTATLPERVAPGSKFRVPFTFDLGLPAMLSEMASGYGQFETVWGYTDNVELNATIAKKTTAHRFARISAEGKLPEKGEFTLTAASAGVRVEVPRNVTGGTVDLTPPGSSQIPHPRTDIGGRVSFTLNAQLRSPAYATPLYAVLVCTLPRGVTAPAMSVTIDPDAALVNDDPIAIDNPEVPVVENDSATGKIWMEIDTADLSSGSSAFTVLVSNANGKVPLVPRISTIGTTLPTVTSKKDGTASFGVDIGALGLRDGTHVVRIRESSTLRTGTLSFTVKGGRLDSGTDSTPVGSIPNDVVFGNDVGSVPEDVLVTPARTVPVSSVSELTAPLSAAGPQPVVAGLSVWTWGVVAAGAVALGAIISAHGRTMRRLRDESAR
ncbi:hypothetical protein BHE97_08285 [Aeromicrobium sp. PE09-221]|uniref:DUF6801 domain-containing protein n=1 Tax=Aeromicrobium sp. PE09-221 TaxID=1898043 RepID=UPI000B3EA393|nr:DUF6801 domain-containing protein [Aeromicrobium sp. PE09-221]OUZ10329.1 hypothetical protein BHE97_08285 [Aeromicrobium sp. PE09-221]